MAAVGGGSKKKNTCWQFESSLVSLECSHGLSEEKASHFADSEFVTAQCIFNIERSFLLWLSLCIQGFFSFFFSLSLSCYRITIQHHTPWHSATASDTLWRGRHVTSSLFVLPTPPLFCCADTALIPPGIRCRWSGAAARGLVDQCAMITLGQLALFAFASLIYNQGENIIAPASGSISVH